MKKLYLVYRSEENRLMPEPFKLTKVFEDETYEVFDERHFEKDGIKAINPRPHIIIRKIIGHVAVNTVYGDFVSEHENEREARIEAGRLNGINQVMES